MEDSGDIVQLINDHGFTVKPIEADEAGVIIDGVTRARALREWELDLVQASAANRAAQPADQEPQPDLSRPDSQVVNHQCTRCEDYKIITRATVLLVGGCEEKMHIEERWLCDRHYELLRKGTLANGRMPFCQACYKVSKSGIRSSHWADYIMKKL